MNGFIDQVTVDFIVNGQAAGPVGSRLEQVRFDPGMMRPWIDGDGQKYVDVMTGRMVRNKQTGREEPERETIPLRTFISNGLAPPIFNTTSLPREVWMKIDRAVIRASRDRLRAWADIYAANPFGGFNGMTVTALMRETATDPGSAKVDMDGIADDQGDTPLYKADILPLPITHSGFHVSSRTLAISRNAGQPFDTQMAENCGRRVAETIEQMTIGTTDLSTLVIGNSTDFTNRGIYGFTTHPDRISKADLTDVSTITHGTTEQSLKDDVLEMIKLAYNQKFYGPFMLYYSTQYDTIMDEDYWVMSTSGAAAPTKTVRQRLMEIQGIQDVRRLDFLSSAQTLLLVQMTSDTVRAVNGMDLTTVQWETRGGMQINFKVMCIQVPDLRSQFVGTSTTSRKCGIVHGTAA